MRIGVIAPSWVPVPPPSYGGIEVVIDNLARGASVPVVAVSHHHAATARATPIAAVCGSVPELIDDGATGFLRSSDVDLALALRAVPTLDRSRCRRAATKRFSTRRMVADHLALYERIVAERHPRRAA